MTCGVLCVGGAWVVWAMLGDCVLLGWGTSGRVGDGELDGGGGGAGGRVGGEWCGAWLWRRGLCGCAHALGTGMLLCGALCGISE